MKTFCFSREQLSILIYALVSCKETTDVSLHQDIDELIKILNK
jgi:hypothetical protein